MYRYDYIWIVELHMHIQTYTDVYMHIWTIYTHTDIWTIYAFQCKCICACILLVYTCTIHAYMNQRFHMSTYEPAGSLMIPVIGASELSSGVFLPSEICMSNSAKINTIAFKFIMCVYSYQNCLNQCLEGSELTDPAPDIANEEVLSLHLVEPALYCIPDPYFQTWSHFRMAKLRK